MKKKMQFAVNPDHLLTTFWITWEALGVAINEVAVLTGDPERIAHLRERMLEVPRRNIKEFEEGTGVMEPAFTQYLKNLEPAAVQSGIDAVEAALSRTVIE